MQLGADCWELFCLEHGVSPDGSVLPDKLAQSESLEDVLFYVTKTSVYIFREGIHFSLKQGLDGKFQEPCLLI